MSFVLLAMVLLFDFRSICPYPVYESVGKVLNFTIAAALKIDVVGNGDGCAGHKMFSA